VTSGFLLVGINELTANTKAFIHFTPNLLLNETPRLFPADNLAIQLNSETLENHDIQNVVTDLRSAGYSLVLEDFSSNTINESIRGLIDIIRVDYNKLSSSEIKKTISDFRDSGIKTLVYNVETWDNFKNAFKFGFDYFQGNFISKPFILAGRDVPGLKINYLQILEQLSEPEINFNKLDEIIKKDVSLSYKLLRMINSSAFGFRNEITSIKQALAILGTLEVKKWCSLVALSDLGKDRPDELVKTSLLRAKFCELIAEKTNKQSESADIFLMGLFSLINAFIPKPLNEILEGIPISKDIKSALLEKTGPFSKIYKLILHYEKGDWLEVLTISNLLNIDDTTLPKLYYESIEWVNQIMQ